MLEHSIIQTCHFPSWAKAASKWTSESHFFFCQNYWEVTPLICPVLRRVVRMCTVKNVLKLQFPTISGIHKELSKYCIKWHWCWNWIGLMRWDRTSGDGPQGPQPGAGSSWLCPCGLCISSKMEATTSVGSVPLFDHPYIDVCGEESCLVFLMLFHWVFISIDEILLSLPASRLSYPSLFVHARCSSPSVTIVALCWTHNSAWAHTVCNLNVLLSWLAYCLFLYIHVYKGF